VNPILAGVALAVTLGAVVAISAREARTALVGLAIALGIAPFLGDPLPQVSTLATRVVAAALTAYLLRAATEASPPAPARHPSRPGGSRIGWPAELLIAAAAWIVAINLVDGLATLNVGGPPASTGGLALLTPDAVTAAAGLASMIIGAVPALAGRDALRTAIGSLVLVQGVLLFRVGVAGAPGDLEQLGGVILLLAIGIAGAWLIGAEGRQIATPPDGLEMAATAGGDEPRLGPLR
jgi:hypothetical protein